MAGPSSDEKRKLLNEYFTWFGSWLRERYRHLDFLIVTIPESFRPGEFVSASAYPCTEARDTMGCREEARFSLGYEFPIPLVDERLTPETVDRLSSIIKRICRAARFVPREAFAYMVYAAVMLADFNRARHGDSTLLEGTTPVELGLSQKPESLPINLLLEPPVFSLDVLIRHWEVGGGWALRLLKLHQDEVGRYFVETLPPLWIKEKDLGEVFGGRGDGIKIPILVDPNHAHLVSAFQRTVESGNLSAFLDLGTAKSGSTGLDAGAKLTVRREEEMSTLQDSTSIGFVDGVYRDRYVFRQVGEYWQFRYRDERAQLKGREGFHVEQDLLARPGKGIFLLMLDGKRLPPDASMDDAIIKDMVMDEQLFISWFLNDLGLPPRVLEAKINRIRTGIDRASITGDTESLRVYQEELRQLWEEAKCKLKRRKFPPEARKPYDRVRNNHRTAVKAISAHMPKMGQHLWKLIDIGLWCEYRISPDDAPPWKF